MFYSGGVELNGIAHFIAGGSGIISDKNTYYWILHIPLGTYSQKEKNFIPSLFQE